MMPAQGGSTEAVGGERGCGWWAWLLWRGRQPWRAWRSAVVLDTGCCGFMQRQAVRAYQAAGQRSGTVHDKRKDGVEAQRCNSRGSRGAGSRAVDWSAQRRIARRPQLGACTVRSQCSAGAFHGASTPCTHYKESLWPAGEGPAAGQPGRQPAEPPCRQTPAAWPGQRLHAPPAAHSCPCGRPHLHGRGCADLSACWWQGWAGFGWGAGSLSCCRAVHPHPPAAIRLSTCLLLE